jgi:hypothetical protein
VEVADESGKRQTGVGNLLHLPQRLWLKEAGRARRFVRVKSSRRMAIPPKSPV